MLSNLFTANAVLLLATIASLPSAFANPISSSSGEGNNNNNSTIPTHSDTVPSFQGHHSRYHSRGHNHSSSSSLASRGVTGRLNCGNFPNADGSMANSLVKALGEGGLATRNYEVAAHGCNRVNCWDTSGVYVCNDNSHSISVTGAQVHHAAQIILNECCAYSQSGGQNKGKIMAGQQFTQGGWNVIIGYANCNHPITQKPSDTGGWGVNGGSCMAWQTTVTNG